VDAKTAWCTLGEDFDRNKENMDVLIVQTELQTVYIVYCVGKFDIIKFLHQLHHFIIRVVSLLSFVLPNNENRKQRSLNPYSKLKRVYTVNIASQADLGQWQFTSAKILLSTEHA
jgi:hypothetical protein